MDDEKMNEQIRMVNKMIRVRDSGYRWTALGFIQGAIQSIESACERLTGLEPEIMGHLAKARTSLQNTEKQLLKEARKHGRKFYEKP